LDLELPVWFDVDGATMTVVILVFGFVWSGLVPVWVGAAVLVMPIALPASGFICELVVLLDKSYTVALTQQAIGRIMLRKRRSSGKANQARKCHTELHNW
jgi:hypothetical protein